MKDCRKAIMDAGYKHYPPEDKVGNAQINEYYYKRSRTEYLCKTNDEPPQLQVAYTETEFKGQTYKGVDVSITAESPKLEEWVNFSFYGISPESLQKCEKALVKAWEEINK
jgi:hypothetical protein